MGAKTSSREAGEDPAIPIPRECLFNFFLFYVCMPLYILLSEPNHIDIAGYFQIIRIDMKLANEDVSMLAFTSEQITAPFLLPEMVVAFPFFRTMHFYS